MNGVIYARFSSDHQREESIEGQLRICKEYAQKKGINVINEYVDRAISGKTDKRPAFQKMIADSDTRLFQVVIVYALDRFARNGKQSAIYENILNLNGVQLQSATENINGTPSSIILKSVLQGVAEYYSAELAVKITRGMTENALKGKWTSGIIPFGYIRDEDKFLHPHPINAAYVKLIFEMFAAGNRTVDIADYLNCLGIRTSSGGTFNKNSFHVMLTNKIYIGEHYWKNIKMEGIPALISHELFYKAQKVLEMRKLTKTKAQPSENYVLASRLFCAHCNGPLVGMCGTSKYKKRHYYYICSNKHRKKVDCHLPNIPQEYIEGTLTSYLAQVLSDDKNIADIVKYAMTAQHAAEDNAELLRLQDQQRELKKKIDNCIKVIEDGLVSDAIIQRLKESEAAMATIKQKISEQTILLHSSLLSEGQIAFFLRKMAEDITVNPASALRALVRTVFVEYKKDSDEYIITARFNYCNTDTLHSLEEFSVRNNSILVNIKGNDTNFGLCFFQKFFQFSYTIPRKSQCPTI